MSRRPRVLPLTHAIHPTSRGFGWVAFEGPFAAYDWRTVAPKADKNAHCLRAAEKLIARLEPETLVLDAFNGSKRATRITRLCCALMSLAADRGVEVAVYGRSDVVQSFAGVGARTRRDIAEAVVRHVDAFRYRLPKKRRAWDSEDPRMSIFTAGALILTHYALSACRLLNELRERT